MQPTVGQLEMICSKTRQNGSTALLRARPTKAKSYLYPLSSLLLYAGFYLPLYFSVQAKLTNTADIIRLILQDKAVHGYYSGYRYQRGLETYSIYKQQKMQVFTHRLTEELYNLEMATPQRFTNLWD